MRVFSSMAPSVLAFLALASLTAPARAATSEREEVLMAAAACLPFFSTTQARYSASGLTNGGTSQFYVVCSAGGPPLGVVSSGIDGMSIYVSNPTANPIQVNCTARPGYLVTGGSMQGASPKSKEIPAGSYRSFTWIPLDFGTSAMKNPNFTCTLPPGATINFIRIVQLVNVGA